jgi:hypothetical protein
MAGGKIVKFDPNVTEARAARDVVIQKNLFIPIAWLAIFVYIIISSISHSSAFLTGQTRRLGDA